ncbi:MAG: DUF975 family protein [Lachnospiraceae bacterium]|nr:DUF975 family protein [Lachnospiraceae bacterium]
MNNDRTLRDLKGIARGQLIGRYGVAIPAVLLIAAIQFVVILMSEGGSPAGSVSAYLLRYAISLIIDLLTGILFYGRAYFFLKAARCSAELSVKDVFTGFKSNMDKAIILQAPFTALAFLCTLPVVLMNLGLIPSPFVNFRFTLILMNLIQVVVILVADLYLGLSFYILADSPDMDALSALKESVRLMEGRKLKLAIMCLSLIPLMIGAAMGLMIGLLWFDAFFRTLMADFYLDAKGEELKIPGKDPSTTLRSAQDDM